MKTPAGEEELFRAALRLSEPERAAFLDREFGGDAALRARLNALVNAPSARVLADRAEATLPTTTFQITERRAEAAVGQTIGRYKLLEKVGEGGGGVVYLAEQNEPIRRSVAVKVIKLGMDTQQVVARFEAERQALALMDHPNIAKVLDAGATETGRPYFVMELVRGIRITDYCDQHQLRTKERLNLFIKVCHAIQHAHQKGIIHRDIKPSNILVTLHDGVAVPKVIDFGIAKATEGRLTDATVYTQLHQFIGTPAYMSPEQAEMSGLDIDTRSDIYSLGVLLYELLTGKTPFDGKELVAAGLDGMRKTIREQEPLRPSTRLATLDGEDLTEIAKRRRDEGYRLVLSVKRDLDWIVMKCLEKDRTRRYATANGLAMDLKRHLADEPVIARPPSTVYRLQKAWLRNKLLFSAGGAIVFAVILGSSSVVFALVKTNAALKARIEAERRSAVERVRFAILGGDRERTEQALKEAERAELPEANLRFFRGLHLVTAAEPWLAVPELEAAHRLQPRSAAALGLLAAAVAMTSMDYEKFIPQLAQAVPVTADDFLFLGHGWSFANSRRGISLMERAVQREDSPMARILLADAKTREARQSGEVAAIVSALRDIEAAQLWARNSLPVTLVAYEARKVAADLHRARGENDLAELERAQAELANERLETFYPNPRALCTRLDHLLMTDRLDEAHELARKWSGEIPQANLRFATIRALMWQGNYEAALLLSRKMEPTALTRMIRFMSALERKETVSEATQVMEDFTAHQTGSINDLFAGVAMNLILGRTEKSEELARGHLRKNSDRLAVLDPIFRRVVEYLAREISENALLNEAKQTSPKCLAHHFVALHHLAEGNRNLAHKHFQAATETRAEGDPAFSFSMFIKKRLDEDPDWPRTIPVVKRTEAGSATETQKPRL